MHRRALTAAAALTLLALAGCGESDEGTVTDGAGTADTTIAVTASDEACELSATTATPGSVAFAVTNEGTSVTEFYLYSGDDDIVGEAENIGPGLTRTLTVDVTAGDYVGACKPGGSGDGVRVDVTVQ